MEIKEKKPTNSVPEKSPTKQTKNKSQQATKDAKLYPIEELAKRFNTPRWALNGAKVAYGWGGGKQLSESEYRSALTRFMRGPLSR